MTVYRAAKYIWHALDSLTSFRVDVALLDGAAVTGSLLKRDFDPASSMMFLLSISDLLEDYTLQKTKNTLKESLTLNIDTVWVVNDGEGMVNEATMTGEPLAVHKMPGKTVHAGTVVEEGNLIVQVYSFDKETRLNKIINLIENSEELKADAQSKAEELADSIVPYSFLTTFLTYLITRDSTVCFNG